MNIVRLAGALFLTAFIVSCGTGGNVYLKGNDYAAAAPAKSAPLKREAKIDRTRASDKMAEESSDEETSPEGEESASSDEKKNAEAFIIYEADCTIVVRNVRDSVTFIDDMLKKNSGYIEKSSSSYSYSGAYMVIRVPLAVFESFVESLEKLGTVERKEITASNVTDQVSEYSARLASLEKVRTRLNDLLKKAREAGDKIAILKEIDRIQSRIESVKARIEYLKKMAAYSTVRLTLKAERQDSVRKYLESPFEWIKNLNPERRSIVKRSSVKIKCPEGYFDLDKEFSKSEKYLYTLPGDVVGIREGEAENYPFMNADFWKNAFETDVNNRMYKIIESRKSGKFQVYHVSVQGGKYYTAAFAVREKKIIVIESLYNSEKTFKAERDKIEKMIAESELK